MFFPNFLLNHRAWALALWCTCALHGADTSEGLGVPFPAGTAGVGKEDVFRSRIQPGASRALPGAGSRRQRGRRRPQLLRQSQDVSECDPGPGAKDNVFSSLASCSVSDWGSGAEGRRRLGRGILWRG